MGDAARRRQLVQNDIEEFDCCLTFDVNEYCIEYWPTLTFKNRQSVWSTLQNDEDFDWDSVTSQIDTFITNEAATNPNFVIDTTEEEIDDGDDQETDELKDALYNYVLANWDDMDQEEDDVLEDLFDVLITTIDEAVEEYYSEDDEETNDETNDEDKPVD